MIKPLEKLLKKLVKLKIRKLLMLRKPRKKEDLPKLELEMMALPKKKPIKKLMLLCRPAIPAP